MGNWVASMVAGWGEAQRLMERIIARMMRKEKGREEEGGKGGEAGGVVVLGEAGAAVVEGGVREKGYEMGRLLGRGAFGVTHECREVRRGGGGQHLWACKSIAKSQIGAERPLDAADVRREVQIMHHLAGHPNILELKEAFEDPHFVHLILELCTGGDLFDRALRFHLSERLVSSFLRSIALALQRCHSLFVIHRDIKPDNFLFLNSSPDSPLKAIDFGLSTFFKPGEVFTDLVGTPYYMAPEVILRNYGPAADVWSAGVILYLLLSGMPPFHADSEDGILKAVLEEPLDLQSDPWPRISDGAKDLVRQMLQKDPKERITVQGILSHAWIRADGEAPDKPLDNVVLERMKQFNAMNKLQQLALKVIAQSLTDEEIAGLKEIFTGMDIDNSGNISYDELKQGLEMQGANLSESEVQELLESADIDKDGQINYMEFVTATVYMRKMHHEDRLLAAFQYFDKDNDGYITASELEQAFKKHNMGSGTAVRDIIAEVDTDKDGRINFEEFEVMMRKGAPHETWRRRENN